MVAEGNRRKQLSTHARESLGDARLLLETAAHNAQAAVRNTDYDEALVALENAVDMTTQALASLQRVRDALG